MVSKIKTGMLTTFKLALVHVIIDTIVQRLLQYVINLRLIQESTSTESEHVQKMAMDQHSVQLLPMG